MSAQTETSDIRRVALASFVGSTLEWYDFFIFGSAAALVFNQLFFPSFDPLTGVIASFATFAIGFIARPIGGIVFGHYGDRIGRKAMLVLSLTMMGGVTFLIGLLPGYASIGIWAPILLTTLRFLQGFAVGGEWGGATLMVVEHAPAKSRGFYGSWPQMGIPAALLLSSGVMAAVSAATTPEQFSSWGWRVPFLLSGLLLVVGIIIRRSVTESPSFQKMQQAGHRESLPLATVVTRHRGRTGLMIAAQAAENTSFYVIAVYALSYLTTVLGFSRAVALEALMIGATACLVAQPLMAALSDRIGRRRVYIGGAAFIGLAIVPFFLLLNTRDFGMVAFAMVAMLAIGQGAMQSVKPALFAEQYEASIRYSGLSIAYQFATVVWSGPTPILAASLWAWSGSWWPLALYVIAASLIAMLCTRQLREAAGRPLAEVEDRPQTLERAA
ncbi:MFS transporter [Roseomonas sp. 18066]|uniref:MFS transporter n=1 Tax=Roseomonas sp. 18066 TaxID=2681412 RepID=UPI001358092D|nr:MFS transporter [Roseomonas sp. 18066]